MYDFSPLEHKKKKKNEDGTLLLHIITSYSLITSVNPMEYHLVHDSYF